MSSIRHGMRGGLLYKPTSEEGREEAESVVFPRAFTAVLICGPRTRRGAPGRPSPITGKDILSRIRTVGGSGGSDSFQSEGCTGDPRHRVTSYVLGSE
jgi:hypothetical protein